jgi:hypothetical protein
MRYELCVLDTALGMAQKARKAYMQAAWQVPKKVFELIKTAMLIWRR